jgi:hypothetical protein
VVESGSDAISSRAAVAWPDFLAFPRRSSLTAFPADSQWKKRGNARSGIVVCIAAATQMQAAEKWFLSLAVLSQRENLESCAESL